VSASVVVDVEARIVELVEAHRLELVESTRLTRRFIPETRLVYPLDLAYLPNP